MLGSSRSTSLFDRSEIHIKTSPAHTITLMRSVNYVEGSVSRKPDGDFKKLW